jgi:hypothetical protein
MHIRNVVLATAAALAMCAGIAVAEPPHGSQGPQSDAQNCQPGQKPPCTKAQQGNTWQGNQGPQGDMGTPNKPGRQKGPQGGSQNNPGPQGGHQNNSGWQSGHQNNSGWQGGPQGGQGADRRWQDNNGGWHNDHDRYWRKDFRGFIATDRIFRELRRHHYDRFDGQPYWFHGRYVVKSYDRSDRPVFIEINPYTGEFIGIVQF